MFKFIIKMLKKADYALKCFLFRDFYRRKLTPEEAEELRELLREIEKEEKNNAINCIGEEYVE